MAQEVVVQNTNKQQTKDFVSMSDTKENIFGEGLDELQRLMKLLKTPPDTLEECSVFTAIRLAALFKQLWKRFAMESNSSTFISFRQDFPQYLETLRQLRKERNQALFKLYQLIYASLESKTKPQMKKILDQIPVLLEELWEKEAQKDNFLRQPYFHYMDKLPIHLEPVIEDSVIQTLPGRPEKQSAPPISLQNIVPPPVLEKDI